MAKEIHIHLHRAPARDAGWEESKHPRKDDGKFGTGSGASEALKHRGVLNNPHSSAENKQHAAEQLRKMLPAKANSPGKAAKPSGNPRATAANAAAGKAQKEDAAKRDAALAELKKHPQYTEADFTYLKDKGYEPDEIRALWDRDQKAGREPEKVNKNSKEHQSHLRLLGEALRGKGKDAAPCGCGGHSNGPIDVAAKVKELEALKL